MPVSTPSLRALLATIKKLSPASRLSEAVELVPCVFAERETSDEAVLVVQVQGWASATTAVLYPDDKEWACDCGGADPCVHVFAAALALESSRSSGNPLRTFSSVSLGLRYDLSVTREGLRCQRMLTRPDGSSAALKTPLGDSASVLSTTDTDLALDRSLGRLKGRAFPVGEIPSLFALLAKCSARLGEQPVSVSPEPLLPRAAVRDHPDGFAISIERHPSLGSVVCAGVARVGDTLRPLGAIDLTGPRLERLGRTETVKLADTADFVLSTLPALRAKVSVDILTHRLPEIGPSLSPRIDLGLELKDQKLCALPHVVYGDPARARVQHGKLQYLQGLISPRDSSAEVSLGHSLRDELGLSVGARTDFTGTDAVKFIARLREWSAGASAPRDFFGAVPLTARFEVYDNGFELDFESPAGPSGAKRASGAAVLEAWRDGLDVVPLIGGGFAPLPLEWLAKHGDRVARLLAAKEAAGALPRAALPALAKLCDALLHPKPPSLAALGALSNGLSALPEALLPADLNATLRPYQRRGVDWLCFLRDAKIGALLADDMGLGKTLQTLTTFRGRVLVVCPRSVLHNWADEISRFRPGLGVKSYHGPNRSLTDSSEVTLTTYAILRADAELLASVAWDIVVLDEAQAIKNPDSQSARAAYALKAGFRVALSGTPVENRLEELWSLMHFTNPGLLGGRADFDEVSAKPIARGEACALTHLRELTSAVLLRRIKRDVAPELPPRTEVVLRCELDDAERAVYDSVRAATQKDLIGALREGASALMALEALLRLRQAACHSALVPGQSADGSSKLDCLLDALESATADGHKSLVFSQWTSLLDLVEPHLRAANIAFVRLDGSTRDRAGVIAGFHADPEITLMLVSLKAGGTGLNLTAADHVFLLDPWWNPAVEDQAEGRAHRIGQHRPVTVYKLVAKDTVEEKILLLQSSKRALSDAALSGALSGAGAAPLNRDELIALLTD